jgi:hypothetical protein
MTKKKTKPSNGRRRIRVGDRVSLTYGFRRARAEVVEDRGNIGAGGRRILRVRLITKSPGGDRTFEVPRDEVIALN